MKKQLNEDKERCPICKSYDHVNYGDSEDCNEVKHKSLSDKKLWMKHTQTGQECYAYPQENIKQFIEELNKKVQAARMHADMDEPEFWATSTISPKDAEERAKWFEEFIEELNTLAGKDLT